MRHIPYGYRIENSRAVIDEKQATTVREFFQNYIFGMALMPAAEKVGLKLYHGSAGRMLRNKKYLGDDYYPAMLLDQVLDGLSIIHGIQSIRQLADTGFAACGRLPDLLKGRPQLIRIGSPAFYSRGQPGTKDIRIIIHLCAGSGEQLFQPCGVLRETVLLCLEV